MKVDGNRLKIELCARIGITEISLRQMLNLARGDIIPFSSDANAPIDILANQHLIARGTIASQPDQNIAITLTEKL